MSECASAPPSPRDARAAGAASEPRWRAFVAMVLVAAAPIVGVSAAMVWAPDTTLGKTVFLVAKVWMVVVPIAWRFVVDRRPPSWSPPRAGGFGPAIGLGVAIAIAVVVGYFVVGRRLIDVEHVREIATRNGIGGPAVYLAAAVGWIFVNSVIEEFVYRWFLVEKGEVVVGSVAAIPLSAALFTVHHVVALRVQFDWPVTIIASLGIFVGGTIWSWVYARYRSIWPCWVSHAIVDVAVFGLGWTIIFG